MTDDLAEHARRLTEDSDDSVSAAKRRIEGYEGERWAAVRGLVSREWKLSLLIDRLEEAGTCPEDVHEGAAEIRASIESLRREYGSAFEDALEEELIEMVDRYPTAVCYVFELEPMANEVDHVLETRDTIEIVISTLPDERVSSEVTARIDALDDVLRCKCRMHEETYDEIQDFVARPHYPQKFWWRHPDQLFGED